MFNKKLARYYDDVTRETRENFERGAFSVSRFPFFSPFFLLQEGGCLQWMFRRTGTAL
jgi:hypothetical protein